MATASRYLFLASGAFWLLIGILTPLVLDREIDKRGGLFVSSTADAALFGDTPEAIRESNPALTTLRGMLLRTIAGLLVAAGSMVIAVSWFGLKPATSWALGALTFVGIVVIPYWWITFRPYRAAGVAMSLLDIPPFMWAPAFLMPLAAALGWIAYSSN